MLVSELSVALSARIVRDSRANITGVSSISSASPEHLIFVEDPKYLEQALASNAGVVLVGEFAAEAARGAPMAVLVAAHPRLAFAQAAALLLRTQRKSTGVHPTAVVDPSAQLGRDVSVGAVALIGANVSIGERTHIGPGCVLRRRGDRCGVRPGGASHHLLANAYWRSCD